MRYLLYFAILVSLSGCYVLNSSIMLRTGNDFKYSPFGDSLVTSKEYKISANDIIEFKIFSNDGFKLIDLTSVNSGNLAASSVNLEYIIEFDGYVKFPVLGKIKLSGLTVRQAEIFLEEKYSNYYVKPFVLLKVKNRRVIIFPGSPGEAQVISLTNNNTKLIEALAMAGGISQNGKARKIKLIRGNLQNPEIYLIDLSRIEGIKQADMTLQSNDIIYVEPRLNISRGLLNEITPILSLASTIILAYGIIKSLK